MTTVVKIAMLENIVYYLQYCMGAKFKREKDGGI